MENNDDPLYKKIFSFLATAMAVEIMRLKKENTGEAAVRGCQVVFKEFLDYNSSLDILVNSHATMIGDITCLCGLHGVKLCETFQKALIKTRDFFAQERYKEMILSAVPRTIHPMTLQLLEVPELTPTAYLILNNYILRRNEHEDITSMLSPSVPRLNHYPIIRELRILIPFYTIVYVNRSLIEENPAIQGIALALARLFGKEIQETTLHKKMLLSASLYKSDMEFLQGLDMFQTQIQNLKHLLKEHRISAESPGIQSCFILLDADKRAGVDSLARLMQQLAARNILSPEQASVIRNNLEIGANLLDKAIGNYRAILTESADKKAIDDSLIEVVLMKVVSGSDFINASRFLREIIRDYKDGKYSDRVLGISMNSLIKYQSDFVRFDNFNDRQQTLEKSVQNRALMLAKDLKDILSVLTLSGHKPLPLPLLSTILFYYRFLLGNIFKDKSRNHILASQLDYIADGPSTPNDFTFFRRIKKSAKAAGDSLEGDFEPIEKNFALLAASYTMTAEGFASECDFDKNPELLGKLRAWLFR